MTQAQAALSSAIALLANTDAFRPVAADAGEVKALVGDKIVFLTADKKESDVLTVVMVKKKVTNTVSDVNGEKMSVPMTHFGADDIELEDGTFIRLVKSVIPPKPGKKGRGRVEGAPTKADICRGLFIAAPDAPKAVMCKLFQSEAGCTRMGANTYFLSIAKAYAAGKLKDLVLDEGVVALVKKAIEAARAEAEAQAAEASAETTTEQSTEEASA